MLFFFKLIYFLRKKLSGAFLWYQLKEYQALYPGRIDFSDIYLSEAPGVSLDASGSSLQVGPNTAVKGRIFFSFNSNGRIVIGPNCFFNNGCSINSLESITIGSDCLFGENVKLYDHNHQYRNRQVLIKEQGYTTAPIVIGNNCWIGSNVTILKGASIGDNCVIGTGATIYKSVPSDSVVFVDSSTQKIKVVDI